MSIKLYAAVSGTIFAIVAVVQVVRAFNAWPVQIASLQIPVEVSWLAALGAGALAAWAFSVARR
jgi:hypothetical protein